MSLGCALGMAITITSIGIGVGCTKERGGTGDSGARQHCAFVQNAHICWLPAGAKVRAGARSVACADGTCIAETQGAPLARRAPPFACTGERCTQRRPRHPDDGEWECSEGTGVTVCRGGLGSAGVSAGSPEPGWECGAHFLGPDGGSDAGAYPRVCVDFAPDYPSTESWSCRYAYVNDLPERHCVRSPSTRAGDRCASGACPKGTLCLTDRCLPPEPNVGCFFDHECGAGKACLFGSCRDAS